MFNIDVFKRAKPRSVEKPKVMAQKPRSSSRRSKLGIEISETTVAKYMVKRVGPPSQSWRTFLLNHAKETIALDFFTVPTATFKVLFVLIVLSHDRRRILHFNVTEHPRAWSARQLLEACGPDDAPDGRIPSLSV